MAYRGRMRSLMFSVRETYDRSRAAEINEDTTRKMANQMLTLLRQYEPKHPPQPPDEGVRKRAPHTSISAGWDLPKTRTTYRGGASAIIGNRSEHIDVIRYGHGAYTVPNAGEAFQRFYFRPEWAQIPRIRRHLHKMMLKGKHPVMTLYITKHEPRGPWEGEDFVKTAARQGKLPLRRLFHTAGMDITFGELKRFWEGL